MHEEDGRPPNENHMLIILALLTTDVLALPKDGVCKIVVSFA